MHAAQVASLIITCYCLAQQVAKAEKFCLVCNISNVAASTAIAIKGVCTKWFTMSVVRMQVASLIISTYSMLLPSTASC